MYVRKTVCFSTKLPSLHENVNFTCQTIYAVDCVGLVSIILAHRARMKTVMIN